MPTYVFRCDACGPFDRRAPMSAVPAVTACPTCDDEAPRAITAPALHAPGTAHRIAAEHERSAHAPGVTAAVPAGPTPGAGPRRPAPADPRHARLPRP